MLHDLATFSGTFALLGVGATVLVAALFRAARRQAPVHEARPVRASILKPLCGVDDDLAGNLASFAALDGAEVLLGVASPADPAWPVAMAAAARWPERFTVHVQRTEPGLNPKVNQLVTLAEAARHELLVISDSNVRADAGWLEEIDTLLRRPEVGLVSLPPVGEGAADLGAALDALHLSAQVAPGMVAARYLGQPIVVGKTMAFHRDTLRRLGGFAAFADVLAEDYVMGRRVEEELGLRVAIGRTPVRNVSHRRSMRTFLSRYRRWSVMQRHAVGAATYTAQGLLTPFFWALVAAAIDPRPRMVVLLGVVGGLRILTDLAVLRCLPGVDTRLALLAPLRDVALGAAWVYGWTTNRVDWRGHTLHVAPGTYLHPAPDDTTLTQPA